MKKTIMTMAVALVLGGCTATIKESRFIQQDEQVTSYTQSFIADLDKRTPNHQVIQISMQADNEALTLNGLHLDHPSTSNTILYIPGNGMSVEKAAKKALVELAEYGSDIVIFDRRGLGASDGKATIANLISDANLSFDYAKNILKAEKVIVHGYSLGSFVAAQVAKNKTIDGLVMQGSATNVDDWIDEAMPWYSKVFVNVKVDDAFYKVDNRQVVSEDYSGPLLVIGGGKDKQTPAVLSQKLFDASNSEIKQLVIAEEANHGQMFDNKKVKMAYSGFISAL